MPSPERTPARRQKRARGRLLRTRTVVLAFAAAALAVVVAIASGPSRSPLHGSAAALDTNPNLDPGTHLAGAAPNFTLVDQFGRTVSLNSLRGHVVVLAFIDSRCTAVCPQTTATVLRARQLLGSARRDVDVVAVNTNATATAVRQVRAYSQAHGALHAWQFLTGMPRDLERVWRAYHLQVTTAEGQVDQTPALYVIGVGGDLAELYQIQPSYAGVAQQAQVVAGELARLVPGHPALRLRLSYVDRAAPGPATPWRLPRAGGGTVAIGPDGAPRLYVFFASWLSETMPLRRDLEALADYARIAPTRHLPALTVIDEGSVEPDRAALPALLRTLHPALPDSVAVDNTGRVADGYLVQDQPWIVLASASGKILWYTDASEDGWPSTSSLVQHVRVALRSPPATGAPTPQQQRALLAGSPAPLARLHAQSGDLLGSTKALEKRIRSLRGYPIVVNAWASWCQPCKEEYPLFAQASAHYGRQVAFLGVDTLDYGVSYARAFLAAHPVSYPSYQSAGGTLPGVAAVIGLPTTMYIDRRGRVTKTISGVYDSLGALYGDMQQYLGL